MVDNHHLYVSDAGPFLIYSTVVITSSHLLCVLPQARGWDNVAAFALASYGAGVNSLFSNPKWELQK